MRTTARQTLNYLYQQMLFRLTISRQLFSIYQTGIGLLKTTRNFTPREENRKMRYLHRSPTNMDIRLFGAL